MVHLLVNPVATNDTSQKGDTLLEVTLSEFEDLVSLLAVILNFEEGT